MCARGDTIWVPGAGCRVPGAGCWVPGAGCRVRPSEPWKCLVIHMQFQRSVGCSSRGVGAWACAWGGGVSVVGGAPQRRMLSALEASGNTNRGAATGQRLSPATAQPLSALIGAACGCAADWTACGCAALEDGCGMGAGWVQEGAGWVQGGGCGRRSRGRLQKPQHVSRQGESERFPLH